MLLTAESGHKQTLAAQQLKDPRLEGDAF